MPRPWPRGPGSRRYLPFGLVLVGFVAIGWVFGTRVHAIRQVEAELRAFRAQETRLHDEIEALRRRLAEATLPQVVEREARQQLRWGFPDEERIIIMRR